MYQSLPATLVVGLSLLDLGQAARSTITYRIPIGTCPATGSLASSSETVIQYSTTDSAGSYFLTSTTEGLSQSLYTYTTTDSAGSTIVTSGSTLVPLPPVSSTTPVPVTSIYTSTTTDASGNTIVTTGTTVVQSASGTAATSSGGSPQATGRTPCPAALAQAYTASDGSEWQLVCNSDIYYDDLPATNATSLADCITSCSQYVPPADDPIYGGQGCVAVTFTDQIVSGANCFRKYNVEQVVYGTSPFDSAKLANFSLSPSISVSVVSNAQPTGTGSPAEGTTSSSSAAPTYTSFEPVSPCPIPNGTYYTYPDGYNIVYYIQCGVTYLYNDLPALVTDSFENCMAACDSWVPNTGYGVSYNEPCVAVTYTTYDPNNPSFENCYRHYAVTETRNGGDPLGNGAVRVNNVPSRSVSTGTIASTTRTASTTSGQSTSTPGNEQSTTRSTSVSTTASSASQTSSITGGGSSTETSSTSFSSTAQGGTSSETSATGTSSSATESSTGAETSSTGSSSSTTQISTSTETSSTTSSSSTTESSTGTETSSTSSSSSTTEGSTSTETTSTSSTSSTEGGSSTTSSTSTDSSPAARSAEPCPCPTEGGQDYPDNNGVVYTILCDTGVYNSDLPGSFFADSLESCLESCDDYTPTGSGFGNAPCVAVRYAGNTPVGANCFRMSSGYSTQAAQPADNLCAAYQST